MRKIEVIDGYRHGAAVDNLHQPPGRTGIPPVPRTIDGGREGGLSSTKLAIPIIHRVLDERESPSLEGHPTASARQM